MIRGALLIAVTAGGCQAIDYTIVETVRETEGAGEDGETESSSDAGTGSDQTDGGAETGQAEPVADRHRPRRRAEPRAEVGEYSAAPVRLEPK